MLAYHGLYIFVEVGLFIIGLNQWIYESKISNSYLSDCYYAIASLNAYAHFPSNNTSNCYQDRCKGNLKRLKIIISTCQVRKMDGRKKQKFFTEEHKQRISESLIRSNDVRRKLFGNDGFRGAAEDPLRLSLDTKRRLFEMKDNLIDWNQDWKKK